MNLALSSPESVFLNYYFILKGSSLQRRKLSGEERNISPHVSKKYKPISSWNRSEATLWSKKVIELVFLNAFFFYYYYSHVLNSASFEKEEIKNCTALEIVPHVSRSPRDFQQKDAFKWVTPPTACVIPDRSVLNNLTMFFLPSLIRVMKPLKIKLQ